MSVHQARCSRRAPTHGVVARRDLGEKASMVGDRSSVPRPAALVTGGGHRIGGAIVLALARAGYAVAIHANASVRAAEEVCAQVVQAGGTAAVVPADLADHEAVLGVVPAAAAAVGPLTLLVNNAALFEPDRIGRLDRDRFDRQFAVNLRAPLFLAEAFAAQAPSGGAIVNILDQRVYRPAPGFLSYGLTKSGLHLATTTLAQALAPRLRVNAVAPGPTLPNRWQDARAFARLSAALPLGHGPSPDEVADAVLFLARANNITGETVAVDGGEHIAWQAADDLDLGDEA
jgi:NAD(P)-dependent dehydrogenase (short-subunit alcohol dehydrogenase family)